MDFQWILIPNFSACLTINELVLSLISTTELTLTPLLFKEIAVKTHPDKKHTETNETFVKANKANEKNDLSVLLNIAKELDIDVTEYVDNEILLEQHANELESKIHQIKQGIPWTWYHAKLRTNDMRTSIEQILTEAEG